MNVTCGRCDTVNAGGLRCRECGESLVLYRPAAKPKRSRLPLFLAFVVLSVVAVAGWTAPDAVPSGCYVLMGDNRNDSEDSHIWGFAQSKERFYSGPEAGHEAGDFAKVIYLLSPSSRAGPIH